MFCCVLIEKRRLLFGARRFLTYTFYKNFAGSQWRDPAFRLRRGPFDDRLGQVPTPQVNAALAFVAAVLTIAFAEARPLRIFTVEDGLGVTAT